MGSDLAAPAEPQTLMGLKCRSQCNGQAASRHFAGGLSGTDTRLETMTKRAKKRSNTVPRTA